MITIKLNPIAKDACHVQDFLRSISAHASDINNYEILLSSEYIADQSNVDFDEFNINFSRHADKNSRVEITLPDNCLVLGKDWDKYVIYALDHPDKIGWTIDENFIKRRLMLVGRPDNGVFPGLTINLSVATP